MSLYRRNQRFIDPLTNMARNITNNYERTMPKKILRKYIYLGDRNTDLDLKSRECVAVCAANGKCVRGRNGNMLVEFDAIKHIVVARLLRKVIL